MGTFAERAKVDYYYHLPTKESKLPFSVCRKNQKFDAFVFYLQQTNGS
jgi:hypothetical protein